MPMTTECSAYVLMKYQFDGAMSDVSYPSFGLKKSHSDVSRRDYECRQHLSLDVSVFTLSLYLLPGLFVSRRSMCLGRCFESELCDEYIRISPHTSFNDAIE